jgi:hypothetical protein
MNFNLFKNSNIAETPKNEDNENNFINNISSKNESDIYLNLSNNNRHLSYAN